MRPRAARIAATLGVSAVIVAFSTGLASATNQVTYDFNTTNDLDTYFNGYVNSGTIQWLGSGGISDSGSVNIADTDAQAVFTTKSSYAIGPVGSKYVFSAYMKSVGGNGYSGMGFTAEIPDATNAHGYPWVPDDGLGISVHGGGFVFSDNGANYEGLWDGSGLNAAINADVTYGPINLLASSASQWYKVVFTAERDSDTTFDTKVEVWPCAADGTLVQSDPSAVMEFNNRAASALLASPVIYSYFNLSGKRVYSFDNFSTTLSGGVSVIEAGNPVVLTDGASETSGAIEMNGSVTDDGGASVTDYGFVYGTSSDPTTSDSTVSVGSGVDDSYSGTTAVLANGTYHVRAYATNSNGTSYGADVEVIVTTGSSGGGDIDSGGGSGDEDSSTLAATGTTLDVRALAAAGVGLLALGVFVRRRVRD